MNISLNGVAFIMSEEGFIPVPHIDTDKLCWGYGHNQLTGEPVPESIDREGANALLQNDLVRHVSAVNQHAPWIKRSEPIRCSRVVCL